ncbi:MAG TPA: hypothetical protein VID73_10800, partial [Ktedonobacterales bacterium]
MRRDERRDDPSPPRGQRQRAGRTPRGRTAQPWQDDSGSYDAQSAGRLRASDPARWRSSGRIPAPDNVGAPRMTLPTFPRIRRQPAPDHSLSEGRAAAYNAPEWQGADPPGAYPAPRRREHSAARPLQPRPSGKQPVVVRGHTPKTLRDEYHAPQDDWEQAEIDEEWETAEDWESSGRWSNAGMALQTTQRAPVPALAAYGAPARRPVVVTQAILRRARSPW